MIEMRMVADQGTMQGRITLETVADNPNSYAELLSLQAELRLRANVKDEGSVITAPPIEEDSPPPAG